MSQVTKVSHLLHVHMASWLFCFPGRHPKWSCPGHRSALRRHPVLSEGENLIPPSDEGLGKLWSHVASRSPSGAGVYPPSHPAVAFLHKWPVAPLLEFRSFSKALKKIPLLWHPKEMKNLSLKPVKAILFLNNDMSRLTRLLRILNAMKCCWRNSHSSFVVKCNDCCVLNGCRLVSL